MVKGWSGSLQLWKWDFLLKTVDFLETFLKTVDSYSGYFEPDLWQDATTESVIKATKSHFTQHLIWHMITDNGPQYSSDQFGPCSYLIKTDNGPCTDEIVNSSVKTLVKDIRSPSWPIAPPPIGVHLCQSQKIPTWPYNERRKDITAISHYKKWQSQRSPIKIRRLCWIDDLRTELWD